jgi:hypothetical protein
VTVPKTSVDEYDCFQAAYDDIGFAWEPFVVDAVAVSVTPQPFADHNLRLCVFALDLAHAKASLLWCHDVCHAAKLGKITETIK